MAFKTKPPLTVKASFSQDEELTITSPSTGVALTLRCSGLWCYFSVELVQLAVILEGEPGKEQEVPVSMELLREFKSLIDKAAGRL